MSETQLLVFVGEYGSDSEALGARAFLGVVPTLSEAHALICRWWPECDKGWGIEHWAHVASFDGQRLAIVRDYDRPCSACWGQSAACARCCGTGRQWTDRVEAKDQP